MTTATKTCFKCLEEKTLTDFYRHPQMADGRVNKCKECNKRDVRENRAANADYYKWYDRIRANSPERVAARMEYASTKKNRELSRKRTAEWYARNTDKKRAHALVQRAIQRGILTRMPCEVCGDANSHAHHEDYSKPLTVKWLCPTHHGEAHRIERWFGGEAPTGVNVSA